MASQRDSNALKHRKKRDPHVSHELCIGTGLADGTSARGLAAPPPHRCRDCASSGLPRIFRRAYAGVRTCRRHESLPSQYALPALTRLVRRSHRCRFISLPGRHCHRPPIRLGWASDGTYRLVTTEPSERFVILSSLFTVRRQCGFDPGSNSQTGRERRTSRILLSFSPVQCIRRSTKTHLAAGSVHLP
jgi:hypothetical protein